MEDLTPMEQVFSQMEVVQSIVERLGYSLSMLRVRILSPVFNDATRTDSFAKIFTESSTQAKVGYIVEFLEGQPRQNKLLFSTVDQGHETADFIRSNVNQDLLLKEDVLALEEGVILTIGAEGGADPLSLYTSCIFTNAREYHRVCARIPKIPVNLQRTVNTLGQFGVLPKGGYRGSSFCFFVNDASRNYMSIHKGVSFCSDDNIYVHASVYDGKKWVRHVSGPIVSPRTALFHRCPYCILDGNGKDLYMMYMVQNIVTVDIATGKFDGIALPSTIGKKHDASWYDYTVAPRSGEGLVLVNYDEDGMLQKWVLNSSRNGVPWEFAGSVNLMEVFGDLISYGNWSGVMMREQFPIAYDNKYTVHVRKATKDAKLVFITFGFNPGMFELNMETFTVTQMDNTPRVSNVISRIYHVVEPWPPTQ